MDSFGIYFGLMLASHIMPVLFCMGNLEGKFRWKYYNANDVSYSNTASIDPMSVMISGKET